MTELFPGSGESQLLSKRDDRNFYLHVPVQNIVDFQS